MRYTEYFRCLSGRGYFYSTTGIYLMPVVKSITHTNLEYINSITDIVTSNSLYLYISPKLELSSDLSFSIYDANSIWDDDTIAIFTWVSFARFTFTLKNL